MYFPENILNIFRNISGRCFPFRRLLSEEETLDEEGLLPELLKFLILQLQKRSIYFLELLASHVSPTIFHYPESLSLVNFAISDDGNLYQRPVSGGKPLFVKSSSKEEFNLAFSSPAGFRH